MPPQRPIGGFFGLEAGHDGRGAAFESPHRLDFWNARAALAHLLAVVGAQRVWLPAYVCVEPAAAAAGREVRFYGVGDDLVPDGETLANGLRAGDAVLGVDYFGTRAEVLPDLAQRFPEVTWIQDRAQALWPDPEPWGNHLLYSPRKVMGAPDGGVLISRDSPVAPPAWAADPDRSRLEPARLRAADPEGLRNDVWFPAYRAAEAAMTPEPRPMSDVSRAFVETADTRALAARRRRNAEVLLQQVGDHALLPAERLLAGAPLGVPVLTRDAAEVGAKMAQARVFCARHWAELPSPAADFPREHALSRRLLTLPCDHRYDADDMLRVAQTFLVCA
jgi:hypothetical protein